MTGRNAVEMMALEALIQKRAEQLEKLWEEAFRANGQEVSLFVVMALGTAPKGQSEGGYVSGCDCLQCRLGLVSGMQRLLNRRDVSDRCLH